MKKTIRILIIMLIMSVSITFLYVENTTNVYAATSSLLPSNGEVDTEELTSDDWALITSSSSNSKGNSFDFIKNNTNSSDNGKWMLYCGLGLIILSVIGIVYVIFSSIIPKKKKITEKSKKYYKQPRKPSPHNSTHNNINQNRPKTPNHKVLSNNVSYEEKIKSSRSNSDWDRFFNS